MVLSRFTINLRLYVTLGAVVQQGGEEEANGPSRSSKGEVPEASTATLPSSGILYMHLLYLLLYIGKDCACHSIQDTESTLPVSSTSGLFWFKGSLDVLKKF